MVRVLSVCLLLTSCLIATGVPLHGGETVNRVVVTSESPDSLNEPVQFLEYAPTIDGLLDSNLSHLSVRNFTRMIRSDFEGAFPSAHYRLAYGTRFLYVYIEVEADSLIFRDRAYQMGDGFHMVLARPHSDGSPADEFYVLACSAVNDPRMEWSRRIFWYYNIYDIFERTSQNTKLEFREGGGTISFELLLPWKDVHPYHPWLSEGIGFNLRFVKAIEDNGRAFYDVVHDDRIDSELQPRRYTVLRFAEAAVSGAPQTFVRPDRGHLFEGDTLAMSAATVASEPGDERVQVSVVAGEGDRIARNASEYTFAPGITTHSFALDTRDLIAGGYLIEWRAVSGEVSGESGLTILPTLEVQEIRRQLRRTASEIPRSSVSTLQFKLNEVLHQIDSTRPYETCLGPRIRLTRLQRAIDEVPGGKDPYSTKTGFVRKAYRSTMDSTLQPYMLWIPEDFKPERTYPLLVYLHGSASTEYALRDAEKIIPAGFIALAPRGRGTSNCYTFDHAQLDIAEAISAVISDYRIDTTNIILSGFSMGGYGVYRTFYETPEKFKALAVFSGHPNIANKWNPGNDYPDFTDPETLAAFKHIPVFVFHGARDRNAPYAITDRVVARLRKLGCPVEFHVEADKGHEQPGEETFSAYYDWIERILKTE